MEFIFINTVVEGTSKEGVYPFSGEYLICEPDSKCALPYVVAEGEIAIRVSVQHILNNPKIYEAYYVE